MLAAFGLAACGGGGGGTATAPDPAPMEPMVPAEPDGPTPEEIAATTKAAKTKLDAIGKISATAGLGGSDVTTAPPAEGSYVLSVKRDRMATTVTVTVKGVDEDDDEKFTQAMDLGGGLTMHTRDGEMGVQEVAMVMTDIAEPKATKFGTVHPLNADEEGESATGDDAVALTVVAGTDDMNLPKIMSASFAAPAEGSSTVTHTFLPADDDGDPDTAGDQPREAAMVAGMYDGAMGTYTCSGNNPCTVAVNSKGKVTGISAGWIFTPADGAKVDVADADFLSYGFWLKKTTKDGAVTYSEVAPFTMAHEMSASTGTITGSASYDGSAVGVYVHNVLSEGGGMVESRTAGHFTANATLKAYFGQPDSPNDNIPPNMVETITGTINNFMLSGGEDQDWSVALKGDIGNNFAIENGKANGGGAEGTLTGQFYGAAAETPGAVAGEFNANFSNGAVAGAFGAREKK